MTVTQVLEPARLIIVMGVSGSGKSTVGKALADRLGIPFIDADDLHPQANVEKMRGGDPLVDADRWPWLDSVADTMRAAADNQGGVVCACSALRRAYRERLSARAGEAMAFILLEGDHGVIAARQANRPGHYMPASLLHSQFTTLERFAPDEHGIEIDVSLSVEAIVDQAIHAFAQSRSTE